MEIRETSQAIDEAAAKWAVRMSDAPLTVADQAELETWLKNDTRRLGALAKARAVIAHVHRAKALGPDFDGGGFAVTPSPDVPDAGRRRFLLVGGAAAAGVALVAGLGLMSRYTEYATKRGEVRLVPLADGSSVTLNTASRIAVAFNATKRIVRLLEGEALFDVIPDAARPFVVVAGDAQIVAPAASFIVSRLVKRAVRVLVRNGEVELKRGPLITARSVRLTANTSAVALDDAPVETVSIAPSQVERDLAWREGMLSFEDMRLDQAAAEFLRYSDTHIVIDDPSIAAETVTGLFSANDPEGFTRAVASTMNLHAWRSGRELHLSHHS